MIWIVNLWRPTTLPLLQEGRGGRAGTSPAGQLGGHGIKLGAGNDREHDDGPLAMRGWIIVVALAGMLGGCAVFPSRDQPGHTSEQASQHYLQVENVLRWQGKLKTEVEPEREWVTADRLARNFELIALRSEYVRENGRYVRKRQRLRLRRWEMPVRLTVAFGKSVPQSRRPIYLDEIGNYVNRLQRITNHPMRLTDRDPNVLVLVLNSEELHMARRIIRAHSSNVPPDIGRSIAATPLSIFCSVYSITESEATPAYQFAVILIRAEHTGIMLRSCIHEEFAQVLGAPNDSYAVRPSIFNDNEEYAVLTRHDELLLQILYSPRLRVGMTSEEAMPIVRQIARELVTDES